MPKVVAGAVPPSFHHVRAAARASGCSLDLERPESEVRRIIYKCMCDRPARIALPIFASPYHRVTIASEKSSHVYINCKDNPSLPGLFSLDLPAGTTEVTVNMPNMEAVIEILLNKLFSRNQQ